MAWLGVRYRLIRLGAGSVHYFVSLCALTRFLVMHMSGNLDPIIYVVDPDTRYRDELLRLLERSGFRTEGYTSAEEFFSADPVLLGSGCIIAEMNLPGVSGLELLEMLQARQSNFPMIILTGNPDVSNAVKALQNKATDYLLKPMVERELLGRIRSAVRSSAASA